MLISVGTDLVEIERIRKAVSKGPRFLERVFSESERTLFEARGMETASIAATFAGKEAVLKVLGTGIRGMAWKDIEILREASGKPYVRLIGPAAERASALGIDEILISLTHSKNNAMAFAAGQRRQMCHEASHESPDAADGSKRYRVLRDSQHCSDGKRREGRRR